MGLTVTQSLTPTSSSISLDEKYVARPCSQDAMKDMAKRNLRYRRASGTYYTRGLRYTLVLLGGEGVGKTTLSYQFMFQKTDTSYYPRKNPPALYQKPLQVDGTTYLIDVVDTNTKPEVQNEYLRKASAIMLVYSITSKSSFQAVKQILNDCLRTTASISCQGFPTSSAAQMTYHPMILVGNMRDKSTEREVSEQDGLELARNIGCKFIELSAENTDDVMRAFSQMVKELDEAVDMDNADMEVVDVDMGDVDMGDVDMRVANMGADKHYDAWQVLKSWSGFFRSCFGRRAR